jgi:hypothetical protein
MNAQPRKIERRIRLAGILLITGLLAELVTLWWSHPTAFLFFLFVGGGLMGVGIVVYLFALISNENNASPE